MSMVGIGITGFFLMVGLMLIGENGNVDQGIYLGDAQIPGLAAGFNQPLVQALQLPTRVPAGMTTLSGSAQSFC